MRRYTAVAIGIVFAGLLAAPSPSRSGLDKDSVKSLVREFNEQMRSVRPETALLPVSYVEHEGVSYAYHLPRALVRLNDVGESFRIRKVKYKKRFLYLEMESAGAARFRITLFGEHALEQPVLDAVLPIVLAEVFEFRDRPAIPHLVANTRSGVVHLGGCNHLPPPEDRREYSELEPALRDGRRKCPVCFVTDAPLPIANYGPMRASAVEASRLREIAFPPVEDPEAQAGIRRLGESILAAFPLELMGFDYEFKVLHSELPQAVSFPTGFVYVTDKLLEAVEDSTELKFVLAHEIAHTELYRQPELDPDDIPSIELILPYLRGHYASLRGRELGADLVALVTLSRDDSADLVSARAAAALRKLQFLWEALPTYEVHSFATHPSFASRLWFLDPKTFVVSESQRTFCGLNSEGSTLFRARVLGKGLAGKPGREGTVVCLLVETSDFAREGIDYRAHQGSLSTTRLVAKLGAGDRVYPLFPMRDHLSGEPLPPLLAESDVIDIVVLQVDRSGDADAFERMEIHDIRSLTFEKAKDVKQWVICED